MNILLLGSGGREHALAWKLFQSPHCSKLFIAPGNAGTSQCGTNLSVSVNDFDGIRKIVLENKIQMLVVGPEDPLVNGIADYFLADDLLKKIPVIGPSKTGARLEGSKDFSKHFMQRHNIPTARYQTFTKETMEAGLKFLETLSPPYVLKADGLAAGKGVVIPKNLEEASVELTQMLSGKFGSASTKVVIEEFLDGIELSMFVITDGNSYKILPEAKDYKRIGDGDTGLNTGGMGAVSPVPFANSEFLKKAEERIIRPTIAGLQKENISYKGFLFIGLMNVKGDPFVIEYNVRMGDPETEVVVPRLMNDLVELFQAVANGTLSGIEIKTDPLTAVTVIVASGGYPGDYKKGLPIDMSPGLDILTDSLIFHSGTTTNGVGVMTNGGRVLAVTSYGKNIPEAAEKSYAAISQISFEHMVYRKDIGRDLI